MTANARKEGAEVQALTLRVPKDVHEGLKVLAFASGKSINDVVLAAIGEYLAGQGHQEAVDVFVRQAREKYRVALDKLAAL